MSMDGLSLYASMLEMRQKLIGGRIDKIQQPDSEELLLFIRNGRENYKLLLNASPAANRAHITELKKAVPQEAPMFCMLLRKRISAGKILAFEQARLDRMLKITIEAYNDLGDLAPYYLCCELMGKHSNIILVNENGKIVDSIKHVGIGMSSVRLVMPGMEYNLPPVQDKLDPTAATAEDFATVLVNSPSMAISKALSNGFFGLSLNMAAAIGARFTNKRECGELTNGEALAFGVEMRRFYDDLSNLRLKPCVCVNDVGDAIAAYPFELEGNDVRACENMGAAQDELYKNIEKREWAKRHGASARKVLQNNIERCEKKLTLYADALNCEEQLEKNRLYGELLTANLHSVRAGTDCAVVDNYYTEPMEKLAIPLDKQLSPGENAQRYYKKYQKLKAARDMAAVQRQQTMEELDYLEGQLDNLAKCTAENELGELIDELRELGYIKRDKNGKKGMKRVVSKPMHFVSSDGADIFVGKNNRQNDDLTLRLAAANDIWLHTKNIPGSHVIIKAQGEASLATLNEAAQLAAYYSRARGGENVAVDYTQKKFVKKPAGAKPGMVIYTTNKTAYITPSELEVKKLKQLL